VGAPVLFQGVRVGSVTSITIMADFKKLKANIPVIIEIEPDRVQVSEEFKERDFRKVADNLIAAGLRGMLAMQSFITGQLLIELDFFPNTPVVLRNLEKDYVELPTIPSPTARLARALDKFDFESFQTRLISSLDGINTFVNDPDLTASVRDLKETLQTARQLLANVNKQVDPLARDVRQTAKDIGNLARDFDPRMKKLTTSLERTITGLDKTLHTVRGVVSEDSPMIVELENSLREVSAASRSLREFTADLNQQPEILLRGKRKSGGANPCK